MKLAPLVFALALFACKSAADREPTPAPRAKPTQQGADLPAEAPLEQVMQLPAEATSEMIEARVDRALELLDAMFETMAEHKDDCDRMGRSLERFVEVNRRMIEQLKDLDQHKEMIQERFKPKLDAFVEKWMPKLTSSLTACATHPRVANAFEELVKKD